MKITIDEKVCTKHKMTLQEVLLALVVRNLSSTLTLDGVLDNMSAREILVKSKDDYLVTQHWSDVLDEILCDSSESSAIDEKRIAELAKKMREVYPLGKQKDRFGRDTAYYYRCNNAEVVKKLKKFFLLFGDYPDEEIIDATKRYVAAHHGDYNGKLRLIKYFILKDAVKETEDGNHVEQISDLLTFLENKESEREEEVTNSDDWLMNSRN